MNPQDATEYIQKLTSVLEVTKAFRNILHLDVLLQTIVETAAETLGAEAGSILLYDEEGRLKFRTTSGQKAEELKPLFIEPGQGIAGWTAETGKPAIVNDTNNDERFAESFDRTTGFETRSVVCVPLMYEGSAIGVLEVLNKNDDADFDEDDVTILFSLADQAAISIEHARLQDAQNNYFTHVSEILIGAMDTHVPVKVGHARRVARYARRVAVRLGLSEEQQRNLYFAGLLHDIGLLKLDVNQEWTRERIELHPVLGYEMIKDIILWRDLAPMVLHHHERWDGRGYPHRLEGQAIPIGARIIGACEAFDVITSKHSYKTPLPYEMALREIGAHAGTQFDPDIVTIIGESISESDTVEKKATPPPQ